MSAPYYTFFSGKKNIRRAFTIERSENNSIFQDEFKLDFEIEQVLYFGKFYFLIRASFINRTLPPNLNNNFEPIAKNEKNDSLFKTNSNPISTLSRRDF